MSWWPFSGTGTDAKAQAGAHATAQNNTSRSEAPSNPPTTPSQPPQETHDPDFYAAHPHLAPPSFPTRTPSSSSPHTASSTPSDEPLDPHLPRTMSCRAAFDSAFYCSSLGGHFNDIYRYGQLRSCSEHWSDFWFCMRVKNSYSSPEQKERMVQDRYREKEEKVRSGPSSEDVWRVRGENERVERAFGMSGKEEGR